MIELSIYIPTFRRINQLSDLLIQLDKSFNILLKTNVIALEQFEIVISANDSNERSNIIDVCNSNLNIIKPKIVSPFLNIGSNNNVRSAASQTSGKYIWCLCDDDLINEGTLKFIFELVKNSEFSLLYLEPFIVDPKNLNSEYNSNSTNPGFVNEVLEFVSSNSEKEELFIIDDNWLSNNAVSLLRASSLVYCRATTHRYWTSEYSSQTRISPICIAFDALSGGIGLYTKKPMYVYVDANKDTWAKEWLFTYYYELLPTIVKFLKARKILKINGYTKINKSHYIGLIISMIFTWRKAIMPKNVILFLKYVLRF
jgi:hypothetical protein